jgi:hypothetical protein
MGLVTTLSGSPLPEGKTLPLLDVVKSGADTDIVNFAIDANGILLAVYVEQITSGQLTVIAETIGEDDKVREVITFPAFTAVTTQLEFKTAVNLLSRIRVTATCTGGCQYRIWARGIGRGGTLSDDAAGGSLNLSKLTVTNPTVTNVTLGLSGTEQGIVLPANSKRVYLKTPDVAKLQMTYAAGQSGSSYITIPMGCNYLEENIDRPSTTVYLQSNKNGTVVQVLSWT